MVVPTFVRIVPLVHVMMGIAITLHYRDSQIKVALSRSATVAFYSPSWWLLLLSYCMLVTFINRNTLIVDALTTTNASNLHGFLTMVSIFVRLLRQN